MYLLDLYDSKKKVIFFKQYSTIEVFHGASFLLLEVGYEFLNTGII